VCCFYFSGLPPDVLLIGGYDVIKKARDHFAIRTLSRHSNVGGALIIICALTTLTLAAPGDPLRYRGGVRNSPERYRLNARQLDAVVESLRHKTGFLELHFDEAGFLTLGDRAHIVGGSATARALLVAAVDSAKSFQLEDHSRSSRVVFGRLGSSVIYINYRTGAELEMQPVELDFSDFTKLHGSKEVLAAFDLGMVILHELGHGALSLHDAEDGLADLGDCEVYINRIRRELRLPERQRYYAQVRSVKVSPYLASATRAELIFARPLEGAGRTRTEEFYLSWDLEQVGAGMNYLGVGNRPRNRPTIVAMEE